MRKLVITSSKGGVGKTTICAQSAMAFRDMGYHVGALDLDSSSPTLHLAFGLKEAPAWKLSTENSQIIPSKLDSGIELITMASHWGRGRVSWRGTEKGKLTKQLLYDIVAWGPDIDIIVIDSPPSFSEEIFIITEDTSITDYLIVTQPQSMSLADVERLIDFLRAKSLPIIGVVENFAGASFIGDMADIPDFAREYKIPLLGSIPQASSVTELASSFVSIAQQVIELKPVVLPTGKERKRLKREIIKKMFEGKNEQ